MNRKQFISGVFFLACSSVNVAADPLDPISEGSSSPVAGSALDSSATWSPERELFGEECYQALHGDQPMSQAKREECLSRWKFLPRLVITPTRRLEDIRNVPAAVTVITAEDIERQGIESAAEALRDVPGVDIADAGEPGLKRIRIRGEDSRRVAILIDGQEFIDHREVGTPLLLAPEMIERIEVVRGNSSVLHGSKGIGGVVNFITKKGGYHPVQATISGLYDSATEGGQGFASLYGKVGGLGYRLAGSMADHQDRDTPEGELEDTSYKNDSFYGYLSHQWDKHYLAVSYDDYNASSEVYVDPLVRTTPPFLDFRIDAPQRDRSKVAAFYDGTDFSQVLTRVHLDAYYQESEREFNTFSDTEVTVEQSPIRTKSSIFTASTLDTTGANFQVDLAVSLSHMLIVGFETNDDDLDQGRNRNVIRSGQQLPEEITVEEATQTSVEPFLQDQWNISDDWYLTGGARAYWVDSELKEATRPGLELVSSDDEHVVGAVSLEYRGFADTTVWSSWSQGFVYPSLINLATGAFAGPDFVFPNPELEPETSNSVELGARLDCGSFSLDGAAFFTIADDLIDHVPCSGSNATCFESAGVRDRIYINVDEARTFGTELTAQYDFGTIQPYLNGTWLRRRFERDGVGTYDTGLPILAGRLGVEANTAYSATVLGWINLFLRAETESDELDDRSRVIHRPGWATLNLSTGADIGSKREVKLVFELNNLFDKSYITSTENIPARGRSAVVKLVFDL